MSRSSIRTRALIVAVGTWILVVGTSSADCLPQDLDVVLNTGWDESTGTVIPAGGSDDDWDVTFDATGPVAYDANVISPHPAWLTLPNSQWIAADKYGPNGTYRYETCWCMDDDYSNPNLGFAIRADDQADVFVNGTLVLSLPDGTFNDATALGVSVFPGLLHAGVNCLEVVVENIHGGPTGFNLTGWVTAADGRCCGCPEGDIHDDAATGVDDVTVGLIASGSDDDEWVVTDSASGGVLPRPAEVTSFAGWNVIPGTTWITADSNGPNGHYIYEKCWCMNPSFENPQLDIELLADDRADVFLNGTFIGSRPGPPGHLFPTTSISISDASLFKPGENCVTIDVTNVSSVVTGLNVDMTVTATNAECCPCTDLPPDAEGWWPLDELVGPTAAELLNGHDGTWLELTSSGFSPFGQEGMVINSLTLDGVDDYVAVPDDPGLDFGAGQSFSFDAWIKTGSPVRQAILHKKVPGAPTAAGYSFDVGGGVLSLEIADGTNFEVCVDTTPLADDYWHFVAATVLRTMVGGTTIKLYVNGLLEQTCNPTTPSLSLANAEQLYFGAAPLNPANARLWWKGQLDEIEIFRRALTADEVYDIWEAGNSGKCRPEPPCEDSTGIPMCAGACPPGLTCVMGSPPDERCQCVQPGASCEGSAPQCNGLCPDPDDVCVSNGSGCRCEPPQVLCGDSPYPSCDGACPVNQLCRPSANGCVCMVCGTGVPYDPTTPIVMTLARGDKLQWTPVDCALVYNVYLGAGPRLIDQNADGLADDYGSCHIGDIIDLKATDPSNPPQHMIWYLITAENFAGEGPLGDNSNGQPRQATNVCP